jgi:fatty acid desaturase
MTGDFAGKALESASALGENPRAQTTGRTGAGWDRDPVEGRLGVRAIPDHLWNKLHRTFAPGSKRKETDQMAPPPAGLSVERASVKERIKQRRPGDLPLSAYVSGWIQAAITLAVFLGSLWLLRGETRPALVLLESAVFGWSWFALLMVGHDAMHRAFAPWQWVNDLVAFVTLDCVLFSRASWFQGHHAIHHARPHSKEDEMYLRGDSLAEDMWNLLRMVLGYLRSDIARLVQRPVWHEWLGMVVRIALFAALLPLALLPAIVFLLFFGNYLGLLSHSLPVDRRSDDQVVRQLRSTWDLYPESFLASLLAGGLNAHATHHVFPALPRGAQSWGAQVLREEAGREYRSVQSLGGLWTLFRLRHFSTTEIASIEAIAAGRVRLGGEAFRGAGEQAAVEGASADQRVGERRQNQTTWLVPERRMGDRRASSVPAAA